MRAKLLCRNDEERGRLLDMTRRLRPVALASSVMVLAGGAVTIPTFGWPWLLPDTAAAVAFFFLTRRLNHFRRPELALAGIWLGAEVLIGAGVALAHGPREYLLAVLVLPAVFGSILFPPRTVAPCVILTMLIVVAVGLGFDWSEASRTPPVLWVPVLTVGVLSMTGSALGNLDARSRSTAIVDQLTGVFNRMALLPRAAEIAHQADATASQVAVIVGDVDAFKTINDELGHGTGDAVLKEVARRLTSCVGAFEPVYRFGGEEFVVLLAGSDLTRASDLAECMRRAVADAPILGSAVTMSFGVAASTPGRQFDFEAVFTRADGALYSAKQAGRNRVSLADAQLAEACANGPAGRRAGAPELAVAVPATAPHWRERVARERERTGNWLVRDQVERDHMLDLNRLLGRNYRRSAAASFLAILASAPWFGWAMLIPPVLAGVTYNLIQMRLPRLSRPEYALAIGWLLAQTGTALGFMLAEHSPLFALPLFLLMVIGSAAVFARRAVVLGIAVTALMIVADAYLMHRGVPKPATVIFPLVLLGVTGLTGSAVGRSAIHYRGAAVVDELTGMLNRAALVARSAELSHQTKETGERVAMVLADLDHFKSVNDRHGHSRGDAVLREVAYRIRKQLGAFESVYRLGGEEFAVLLTGVDGGEGSRVAERICRAVGDEPVDGVAVTMSCGVAVTEPGETFGFQSLFARADAALYAAKDSGRDCIRSDASGELVAALAA